MITGNATQISGHFRPSCRAAITERNTRHISLFSCPSHRHQPSPGAHLQLLSSDTFHPGCDGGRGDAQILPPLPKAPHPSSLKWPLLLQKILHPIFPNIANTSPSREGCHLLKLKAKYIEATLFEVNYESSLVRWGKHTGQQRSESPLPPKEINSSVWKTSKTGRFCEASAKGSRWMGGFILESMVNPRER